MAGSIGLAAAQPPNPWGAFTSASPGEPHSIGDYSGGCLAGARALPLTGEGFQVMHPSRKRYFGHPSLLAFVTELGRAVTAHHMGVLLIGDLSQPRGGRALGGHASHQSGLDIDVWYWHPKRAEGTPLPDAQRESLKARSVLDAKSEGIAATWKAKVAAVLELAASDARVERIFVHPWIKRELCSQPSAGRAWLSKVRPWYGHDDHFHVRLACPADSPACVAQAKVPQGDGCDELDYWLSPEAQAEREKGQKQYQAKVVGKPRWPAECDAVLAAPEASAVTTGDGS
jgi:penicillin-insensitive murein endopeptidase